MKKTMAFLLMSIILMGLSCNSKTTADPTLKASKVKIKKTDKGFVLLVNGSPFEVKGAGINFVDGHNFKALAEAGGNTFRTWRTDHLEEELEAAIKYNLMIAVGLDLEKELDGFDYTDSVAVHRPPPRRNTH